MAAQSISRLKRKRKGSQMSVEKVRAQLWAKANDDDDRVSVKVILGDERYSIDMDIEDAKSWATTLEKAVQDAVKRLPVVDF